MTGTQGRVRGRGKGRPAGRAPRVALSWSGGKDCAMALHTLRATGEVEVVSLLTVVAAEYDRVSHHGVRTTLLRAQAAAVGLPLRIVRVETQTPRTCEPRDDAAVMNEYDRRMRDAVLEYRREGITAVAFGDIFLAPLRAYRERKLAEAGMSALFPLWHRDTRSLANDFIALGFRAILACVDDAKLGPAFAGRSFDGALLRDLPADVDPCGEHGEFHSFVHDGPIFRRPVPVRVGDIVQRDVRHFADLRIARDD